MVLAQHSERDSELAFGGVSIPLWFSLNTEIPEGSDLGVEFPSHYGSRSTWQQGLPHGDFMFPSHYGSRSTLKLQIIKPFYHI